MHLVSDRHICPPRDLACLGRRQVLLGGREFPILLEEPSFDEQVIGSSRQIASLAMFRGSNARSVA